MSPTIAEVDGERSYPSLASLHKAVDIVGIFRNLVSTDQQPERKALAAGMRLVSNRSIRKVRQALTYLSKPVGRYV